MEKYYSCFFCGGYKIEEEMAAEVKYGDRKSDYLCKKCDTKKKTLPKKPPLKNRPSRL